jgi:hypothetical protein
MRSTRAPLLIPLLLIAVGVVLLLRNFLLLDSVDLSRFWPVILILAGAQLLVRGDLGISWQTKEFGITRGTVQTASAEVSSGEIDVKVRMLRREGRLVAGHYTARSRPQLTVRSTHARLMMQRGQTWPFSQGDWEIGLARDVPWTLLISTHLGELDVDLRGIYVREANLGTGFGDIIVQPSHLVDNGIRARSTFGNITVIVPPEEHAIITIRERAFARLRIDETRFLMLRPGIYATLGYEQSEAPVTIEVCTTFGTLRLE